MSESARAVLQRPGESAWISYQRPQAVLEAHEPEQVGAVLATAEDAAGQGLTAVGFLTYEAASAFDPALVTRPPGALPLAWFALFDGGEPIDLHSPAPIAPPSIAWTPSIDLDRYRDAIRRIHSWIAAGDTYQVNYTLRLWAPFTSSAESYFLHLAAHGDSRHGAFVDTGRHALCSLSPELFFRLDGERLLTRPMKGTARRGRTTGEDADVAEQLRASTKNRAENVMIVDMMRNDLGRIAHPGSVEVSRLWEVERYPTLFQLTSTCEADTDASVTEALGALFPCASITGAPKVRTMQLIAEIEDSPRGIYTGAIGSIGPGRAAQFNVAIRTIHVDRERELAEYGTGGGIVWDSVPDEEYEETRAKALVVTSPPPRFALLETMRWHPTSGFTLLERHLGRLLDSAAYFGRRVDRELVVARLESAVDGKQGAQRIRLEVRRDGTIEVESVDLSPGKRRWSVALAAGPIDPANRFLFHKTTVRETYDTARAGRPEADDVLLWNPRGEITESTIANVVVRRGGELLTPPVDCALLPGTLRAELLDRGRIREEIVRVDELAEVEAVFLINSVRGWIPTRLIDGPASQSETLVAEPT
jgi:para-aminobenzoate synthetase/4-amino-4-deoxychorismate lyase